MATEMATSLQSIPVELLDDIMDYVTLPEVINLWKSNSAFSSRAAVRLFGNSKARDRTMCRACTDGDIALIRAVTSRGANPSYFNMISAKSKRKDSSVSNRGSTLGRAAQLEHNELFAVLLELGASIDKVAKKERRAIVNYLRKPGAMRHMKLLLDLGVGPESLGGPAFTGLLITYMRQQTHAEFLDYMARGGADLAKLAKIRHLHCAETCSAPVIERDTHPDENCAEPAPDVKPELDVKPDPDVKLDPDVKPDPDVKSALPNQYHGRPTSWWFSDLPTLEVLIEKWGLETMEDPHFFSFMTYLLQLDIGREHYSNLLDTYCWDYPLARIDRDSPLIQGYQPKDLPAWWTFVELLLDKVRSESKLKGPCYWVAQVLPERFKILRYNAACQSGILSEQETKDIVLHELVGDQLVWLTYNTTLARLIITRLIEDGADINARKSLNHPTALQAFCLPILEMTFDSAIIWNEKERYTWSCVTTEAAILMLIDKGCDPYAEMEGLTIIQRLNSIYEADQTDRVAYFEGLTQEMKKAREHFLANGSTPNHLAPRNVVLLPPKRQVNAASQSGA